MSKSDYVVSENVYEALGFADPEGMRVKSRLAMQIADVIKAKGYSQTKAADVLKMTQPKLSSMLRGQFRGISEARMMQCLADLGNNVRIVISAPPAGVHVGAVDVVVRKSAWRTAAVKSVKEYHDPMTSVHATRTVAMSPAAARVRRSKAAQAGAPRKITKA